MHAQNSNDFERINGPRVDKLVAAIETIAKSARSNSATPQEIETLLKPAIKALENITKPPALPPGMSVTSAQIPKNSATPTKRRDITLWQEAQTAPLTELMLAYTTITSRLTDLVDEQ